MNEDNIFGCCDLCDNMRPLTVVTTEKWEQFLCDECCGIHREDIDEEDAELRYFWEAKDA